MPKIKKADVGWVDRAPQRLCSRCAYVGRHGPYYDKFNCIKHGFCTKGNAVCDDFKPKETSKVD